MEENLLNILIIQIFRLGDALQLTPVVKSIRTLYPDARISVLASSLGKEIFKRQDCINDVFVIRKQELTRFAKIPDEQSVNAALELLKADMKPVLSQKWDWVINLSFSFPSALLAFLLHCKNNSGFFATTRREYLSGDKWFSYSLASFPNRKYSIFNWVDINSNIVGAHRISTSPFFPIDKDEAAWAEDQVREFCPEHNELIGIHPGASGNHKRWPIENFIKLAEGLIARQHKKIVIFGDKSEQGLGMRLEIALGENALNLTGRTTLGRTAAMMSHCSLVLCNDSGPMHLASAVGTPIIALFFSTYFAETGPYGENHLVLHPMIDCFPCQGTAACFHKRCLTMIPVEAVEKLIGNRNNIMVRTKEMPEGYPPSVAAYRSRFDPWGFIEWVPGFIRQIDFVTVYKLILKLSFIPNLINRPMEENDAINFARNFIGYFAPPPDIEEILDRLHMLLSPIKALETLLAETRDICLELSTQASRKKINPASIRDLGKRLEIKEDELPGHSSPELDMIIKFIEMQRNNISEKDFNRLASKSVKLYDDSVKLVKELEKNIRLISGLFKSIEGFDLKNKIEEKKVVEI